MNENFIKLYKESNYSAIAFTNNWKVTYFDDERELNQVCNIVELREDECTISNGEYEYDVKFDDIKLLCFPISSLTKEITINGESFVPIDFINKNIRKVVDIYLVVGEINIDIETDNYSQIINLIDGYEIMQKLIEWKFDVFRLIELGLAEPVTEDFNPYK